MTPRTPLILLEARSQISKRLQGTNNTQKSAALPYSNNRPSEKEIRKASTYSHSRKNKILRKNPNHGGDRPARSGLQNTLPKEMKETDGETTLLSVDWKTAYHQDTSITQGDLQIQYNLYQNPSGFFFVCLFFAEIENFTLTVTWVTSNRQTILEKNKAEDSLPHFKTYYKAATIKIGRCWHKIKAQK